MITLLTTPTSKPASATDENQILQQLQHSISASRLMLFLQCRLKFWFRHVRQLSKPKTGALQVGSTVHAVLSAWNKARWKQQPLTLKQTHDVFEAQWTRQQQEEPVHWEPGEEPEQKLGAWRLCETYLRETPLPLNTKPDAVEVPVEADLKEHGLPPLTGILDLVQQRRIIDFKTCSATPQSDKAAHLNEVQTTSYAILYREATGHLEEGIELHHLVKLKSPRLVITPLPPMHDGQQSKLFRLIESYQRGLERKDFVPSPGMQCHGCEFFHECRAWR